jgi:nitrogen fixation NifU-like protein
MDNIYSSDLMEIYKDPSFKGTLSAATNRVDGHNPFCGDRVHLDLMIVDGVIQDARWQGDMCFVSSIGAEFLLEAVIGKRVEVVQTFNQQQLLDLMGLNLSTSRIACATLTLKALHQALADYQKAHYG